MKHLFTAVLALAAMSAGTQNDDSNKIYDLSTGRDGSRMFVNMTVNPKEIHQKINSRLEIKPVLWAADSSRSVEFPSVTVAGKNMYYYDLRDNDSTMNLYRAGKGEPFSYSVSLPYEDWMELSTLAFKQTQSGCCGAINAQDTVPVAIIDLRPRLFNPRFDYIVPLDTAEKRFNLSGRANVRFIVNKTNIDWNYANNYVELDSILKTVNAVKDNPDATVESIWLKGFASPEGPYDNNVRLAKGRTEVVKEYVRKNSSFPASVYHTDYVPEDWEGLREWVAGSSLAAKEEMLAFIDDTSIPAPVRNDRFRARFPQDYNFILTNVYPPLRHTDYRITYTIRKYLNVDEIREVMKTRPQNLSQNEFFLLANSYPHGSPEYDEVFDMAVRMFPESETANLNAANSAMNRGDYKMAEKYLANAGNSPQAVYGRGILKALQKKYGEALPLFEEAQKLGIKDAADAIEQTRTAMERSANGVTYLPYGNKLK